jgi:DNA replication protein DnaC
MSVRKNHILPKRSCCEYDDYYDTDDYLDDDETNYFDKILSSISLAPIKQALIQQAKDIAVSKLVYQVEVTRIRQQYGVSGFEKAFKNVPDITDGVRRRGVYGTDDSYYYDFIMFHKIPIMLKLSKSSNSTFLYTLNKKECREWLDVFVNKLGKASAKSVTHNKSTWASFDCGCPVYHYNRSNRTFKDVFIRNDQKQEIIHAIRDFKDKQSWYKEHNIPYHFGIMLYGAPGTGKSSIISCIANEFSMVPYFVSPSSVSDFLREHNQTMELFAMTDDVKLIVVEDLDSCDFLIDSEEDISHIPEEFRENARYEKNTRLSKYLSDFLNVIDGTKCMENVIWIFTTNHLDKITPALLRPGRVDMQIHIDYVCPQTFEQFIKYHFNTNVVVKQVVNNLSFAKVQTDVMLGKDLDYILHKYAKEWSL